MNVSSAGCCCDELRSVARVELERCAPTDATALPVRWLAVALLAARLLSLRCVAARDLPFRRFFIAPPCGKSGRRTQSDKRCFAKLLDRHALADRCGTRAEKAHAQSSAGTRWRYNAPAKPRRGHIRVMAKPSQINKPFVGFSVR